jgi:flagellar capping protein FliD
MPDEKCNSFLSAIPFIGLALGHESASPLITRLAETAIMSLVAGGFAMYIATEKIQWEIASIKQHDVQNINKTLEKIDRKVDQNFQQLDKKIDRTNDQMEKLKEFAYKQGPRS